MTTINTEAFEQIANDYDLDEEALIEYCRNHHISEEDLEGDLDSLLTDFRDSYIGKYDSVEEFAEQFAEEQGWDSNVEPCLWEAIEWEEVWNSALRHDFWESEGHFFRS